MTSHSSGGPSAGPSRPIDFAALADVLLGRAGTVLPMWLPGGVSRGHEYVCAGLEGGEGRSLSVNVKTGAWADFASDERGGDLTSLYAAIHGLTMGQAARQLMADFGLAPSAPTPPRPQSAPAAADDAPPWLDEPPGATPEPDGPRNAKRKSIWRAITPVPPGAPAPTFRHWHYTDVQASWEYRRGDDLLGYVVRYATSDGGKEILPHTWCVDESDGRGTQRWHWKQWDEPRPLYLPAGVCLHDTVVLVEGEKCALAGHELLGDEFDFVTWPGGSKAWSKADWSWLRGRTVVMWPDCDAKRERLTADERKAACDPDTKPLLPERKQPGMAAMLGIGAHLQAEHACNVLMCPVPPPGQVSDGWDLADAIAQGWTAEQVRAFIAGAQVFTPASQWLSTPSTAGAGSVGGAPDGDWRAELLRTPRGHVMACRENVVLALDGMAHPDGGPRIPGIAQAYGCIAYNEFSNNVDKLRPTPWGSKPGVWDEAEELEVGDWLTRVHGLPPMSRATLEEAITVVARRHRYHPPREHFERLAGTWDGTQRLRTWLLRACRHEGRLRAGEDDSDRAARLHEQADHDALGQYLARVGTWVLMAICARVLPEKMRGKVRIQGPGTKFDYMLILEGAQGLGKSTLTKLLALDWHADTGLTLGEKDSYQNLQGVLGYEWSELDALGRAEIQKVKQFISSESDRFRASFDKRSKSYPRQVVFIGTTNESHYLSDPTGNRRFWPLRVDVRIDLEWVRQHIDQLYAEALALLAAEERFHPTYREQQLLFEPQQTERTIENALESAIRRYLYDETQRVTPSGANGSLLQEVTLADLLTSLGISVDKQTQVMAKQASAALGRLGWERGRASGKGGAVRPWVYRRPKESALDLDGPGGSDSSSNGPTQGHSHEDPDGCPF